MTRNENKDGLALKLALKNALLQSNQPANWLDGLLLSAEGQKLNVFFRTPVFARWFYADKITVFENLLADHAKKAFQKPVYSVLKPVTADNYSDKTPKHQVSFNDFLDHGKNAAALQAVQKAVSDVLNQNAPQHELLLLCGAPGTGKTHLLKAVQTELQGKFGACAAPLRDALYFCSNDPLTIKIRSHKHSSKALLLDNLQALAAQTPQQNNLAVCLDCIKPGLAILAWTGKPEELECLEKNLKSRLHQGMLLKLEEPDLETRLAFLEKKLPELGRAQLLMLARKAATFPLLEGLSKKVGFSAQTNGRAPAQEQLEILINEQYAGETADWRQIMEAVSKKLRVAPEEILGSERKAEFVLARQMAMYLCRKHLGLSYPELGRIFGGKDHSTVMHAIKKIDNVLITHKDMRNLLTELEIACFQTDKNSASKIDLSANH